MILLWGAIVGLLIGWARRGRLRNLERLRIRAGWLVLAALLIQVLIFPLGTASPILPPPVTVPLHFLSYVLLAIFLALNLAHWPLCIMALGLLLNFLVIAANGGHMPASVEALRRAGMEEVAAKLVSDGTFGNVVRMGKETRLDPLGDWLYLPSRVPLATAFSLGDLLIGLGLASFFPYGMRAASAEEER